MRNLLLLLAVILLAVIPLRMIAPTEEGEEIFAGADDQAGAEIERIAPDYEPWSSPLWEPPSGEISSLLFALQAAIGAGLLAYCLGYYRGRRCATTRMAQSAGTIGENT
jgi:cobalt/nickel transport protein